MKIRVKVGGHYFHKLRRHKLKEPVYVGRPGTTNIRLTPMQEAYMHAAFPEHSWSNIEDGRIYLGGGIPDQPCMYYISVQRLNDTLERKV